MVKKKQTEAEVSKRSVFIIQPPFNDSKYVLLVTRAGGMMGSQTAAFGVDRVYTNTAPDGHSALSVRGILDTPIPNELVVEFPPATTYLMVRRSDMRMMTQAELALESQAEEKELEAIFGASVKGVLEETPKDILPTGQYM